MLLLSFVFSPSYVALAPNQETPLVLVVSGLLHLQPHRLVINPVIQSRRSFPLCFFLSLVRCVWGVVAAVACMAHIIASHRWKLPHLGHDILMGLLGFITVRRALRASSTFSAL